MKRAVTALAALAVTLPLLAACNGGRDCDSAPALRDTLATSPDTGTSESVLQQVAAPERSSGGRGGGGRGSVGGSAGGAGQNDCDYD
ncbi:hypothetical protein ACTWP5_24470 [Streptomyces sp. 4N509B]|uniref:hypothetical protein n=1 Tax=Streptomyces sp. 4N509B TaxID=3457413 RepID=UPI003FD32996